MDSQNVLGQPSEAAERLPLVDPDLDLVIEGEKLFGEGLVAEALDLFQRAIDQCQGNVQAWNNLAVAHMAEGDSLKAKNCLKQAIELKPDFLEARFNLAEIYSVEGKFSGAVKELQTILSFKPDDLPSIRRLAQVFISMGKPDKAKTLLDNSDNVGAMKAFIDSLWLGIKFYTMAEGLSIRERLEKLMLAVLKLIDGQDGRSQSYRLVGFDSDSGREVVLEGLVDNFYYQESKEFRDDSQAQKPELILTIGDHEDWKVFRAALQAEMRAEGGCLGDFTQSRKILKRDGRFQRYNLESTLKYFQANVGPCDCHVVRSVLV
ncbi:MAG: tetratricopeptide repeat protein [Deltaproteobacteria bacterium]|jgi:tetratricopeptide (TPR) repeat protein|nr:tetratricopeptide repeat protein [Deltaproteobacteria bacterium]